MTWIKYLINTFSNSHYERGHIFEYQLKHFTSSLKTWNSNSQNNIKIVKTEWEMRKICLFEVDNIKCEIMVSYIVY